MAAAKRSNELGPIGKQVAENVQHLRKSRHLSTYDLARLLAELGRPILATGITKLEAGQRRVDADDLVAIAVALDVSPVRLLLPMERSNDDVQVTPERGAPWGVTWRWAVGEQPLRAVAVESNEDDIDAVWDFMRENRPFDNKHDVMRKLARGVMAGEQPPRPVVSEGPGGSAVKWVYEEREDRTDGER